MKVSILLWLLASLVLIVLFCYLLASVGESRAGQLGDGEFTFVPDWPQWILPALFLGLTAGAVLAELMQRRVVNDDPEGGSLETGSSEMGFADPS